MTTHKNTKTNRNNKLKKNNSKRTKKMSKIMSDNFKTNCSCFWNKDRENFKEISKINILCKTKKNNKKMYYGKELGNYKFIGYEKNLIDVWVFIILTVVM